MWTVPNILTLARIGMVPVLVGAFFLPAPWAFWVPLAIFLVAGATDFLDGYLARSLGQVTAFGRFLDPVADKLLVAAALVMAIGFGRLGAGGVIAALLILCREFVISGLREFLAGDRIPVPVTALAKWKTALQMIAISVVLVGPGLPPAWRATEAGEVLLWIAASLTLITGYTYLRRGIRHMGVLDRQAKQADVDAAPDAAGEPPVRGLKRLP